MRKYIDLMEHIYPTERQKNKMFENIFNEKQDNIKAHVHSHKLRFGMAAVALCFIFSGVVFADEIKETFSGLLKNNELVSEDVFTGIYKDSDEHVEFTIEELVSDKITTKAVIKYKALDNIGKDWLNAIINTEYSVEINPVMKEDASIFSGVACTAPFTELTEYSTEDEKYFYVGSYMSGDDNAADSVDVKYSLYSRFKNNVQINIAESVQYTDYKLDSSKAPEKYYKPTGVKISPISICVYGKDLGMTERTFGEYSFSIETVHEETIDSLNIILNDNTAIDLLEIDYCSLTPAALNNDDCTIYCASLAEPIDTEIIAGIEIDGVYYSLS